jgi:23S rRNA (guanosine2251-2'-O)-methyltransferase
VPSRECPVADVLEEARAAGVLVRAVDPDELERLTGGTSHQGIVAVAPPYSYAGLEDLLARAGESPALLVALDQVTDPHNVGAVARTTEAVGGHGLLIPARRAAGVTPAGEKAAAGALAHLPVARVTNLVRALGDLAEHGVWSVGLDGDAETSVFGCDLLAEPVVIVVGAEGRGLRRLVAESCDVLAALPMRGKVESLNASVAAGVALYEARRARDGR